MFVRRILPCLFAAMLFAQGCEQRIPKEELGTVIFEVPQVPGSEKPPEMPQLDAAEDAGGAATGPPTH